MTKTYSKNVFGIADRLFVTVMVDNKANMLAESTDSIRYFENKPLLAEHGFSLLFHFGDSNSTILLDAGLSEMALIENLQRMKIDPKSIKKIILSHGDYDHFGAMTNLLTKMELNPIEKKWDASISNKVICEWIEKHRVPLYTHPMAFREQWKINEDGSKIGPIISPQRQQWESKGADLVLSKNPQKLDEGCWLTGYIPRQSFEKSGRPENAYYRLTDRFIKDDIEDDQAVVINLKGKGLIILSGCAHSGIINTVNYARELSGENKIYAIIGGFHLIRASVEEIERTILQIKSMGPKLIVPCHCTGFRAEGEFARRMPDVFREGIVGATYTF